MNQYQALVAERDRLVARQGDIAQLLTDPETPLKDVRALSREHTENADVLKALLPRIEQARAALVAERDAAQEAAALKLRPAERKAFARVIAKAEELHAAIEDYRAIAQELAHTGNSPLTTIPNDLAQWVTPGVGGGLERWSRSAANIQ